MGLRYAAFVLLYAVWVIGYTFQTSCTRSGQTVTDDPSQRPLFTIFNTVQPNGYGSDAVLPSWQSASRAATLTLVSTVCWPHRHPDLIALTVLAVIAFGKKTSQVLWHQRRTQQKLELRGVQIVGTTSPCSG